MSPNELKPDWINGKLIGGALLVLFGAMLTRGLGYADKVLGNTTDSAVVGTKIDAMEKNIDDIKKEAVQSNEAQWKQLNWQSEKASQIQSDQVKITENLRNVAENLLKLENKVNRYHP